MQLRATQYLNIKNNMKFTWPNIPADCNRFVFDTNVLIYMHGFIPNERMARKYGPIVEHIASSRANVYIDKVVLGEFINRYINASMEYKLKQNGSLNSDEKFKFNKQIHRDCLQYKEVLKEINVILHQIQSTYNLQLCSTIFSINADIITDSIAHMEFNDFLIANVAEAEHAIIVTNDKDLTGCQNINTLTAK